MAGNLPGHADTRLPLATVYEEAVVVVAEARRHRGVSQPERGLEERACLCPCLLRAEDEGRAASREVVRQERGVVPGRARHVELRRRQRHRERLVNREALEVEAGTHEVGAERPRVARSAGDGGELSVLRGGHRRVTSAAPQRRVRRPVAKGALEGRVRVERPDVGGPGGQVGQMLALVLARQLLRTEVRQLERGAAAHGVQAQRVARGQAEIDPAERTDEIPRVVQVVERHLVEEAIGVEGGHRPEVAHAPAFAPQLDARLARAEAAERACERTGEGAPGPEAAAAVQHGHPRYLAAELGRHVAGEQLHGLHHAGIERVGERAGQLVADREAVHDEGHLVVGAARVDRAVGVLGEAGKRHQHGLEPAARDGRRHSVDARHAHCVAGAGRGGVHGGHVRGHRDSVGELLDLQRDREVHRHCRVESRTTPLFHEALQLHPHVVGAERQVGHVETPVVVCGRHALEAAERLHDGHAGSRHATALDVDDRAAEGAGALCVSRASGEDKRAAQNRCAHFD